LIIYHGGSGLKEAQCLYKTQCLVCQEIADVRQLAEAQGKFQEKSPIANL
jgi:hypothetical protein